MDVVFWTRANNTSYIESHMTAAEINGMLEGNPSADVEALEMVASLVSPETMSSLDIPEGTIITQPYYSDRLLPVVTKAFLETLKAK